MKIYKRRLSSIVKSYFLNLLASFIFWIIAANFIDMMFSTIATFVIYTILMYYTFVKDNVFFSTEGTIFRKHSGKKVILEYNVKNEKVKKELKKSISGYSAMNIFIGNKLINCSILDVNTYEDLFNDLSSMSK